jgi:hypothetical protein
VGIEGGMTVSGKNLLIAAVATSLLWPAAAFAAISAGKPAPRAKIKVHPKRWHGYGFLPGYRQPPDNTDWRRQSPRRYEQRYWYNGQILYGWGGPGFYRGQWNGGSFGPCWTSTPIGMMPTCGR